MSERTDILRAATSALQQAAHALDQVADKMVDIQTQTTIGLAEDCIRDALRDLEVELAKEARP